MRPLSDDDVYGTGSGTVCGGCLWSNIVDCSICRTLLVSGTCQSNTHELNHKHIPITLSYNLMLHLPAAPCRASKPGSEGELAVALWWRSAALQALSAYVLGVLCKGLADDLPGQVRELASLTMVPILETLSW